ncbi:molybdate ABC transporter substrate-binding protein [Terrisporobacter vanillatitrophus]|uniref:molybdate ABC transporter substrate-binding protein n=1 Tax=Terrisporobacter vanillatitrophus TaxID=3058402 RepID=UPI003367F64B
MKVLKKLGITWLVLSLALGVVGCSSNSEDESKKDDTTSEGTVTLNISAAASLQEAMTELETKFKEVEPNIKLEVNLGSSGTLQQQIEQGAACDVFISAGEKQMKALEDKDLLLDGTNKTLLTNDLVLVAAKGKTVKDLDSITSEDVKHIAIGDPQSVPAGKYAKEVLDNTKLYDKVEDKLVLAKDVKEVLSWVQQGNADVGFVYLSDTVGADKVEVVLTTDDDTHSAINYPVAIMKESKKQDKAKAFENFLLSDDGQAILEKYGFKKAN